MRESIDLEICKDSNQLSKIPDEADILIDAMLGIGVMGKLRDPIHSAVQKMNASKGRKYAIDVPTGVNPDNGSVVENGTIKADVTISFYKPKMGLVLRDAKPYVGELRIVGIGLPLEVERIAGPGDVFYVSQYRNPLSHKGDNGRVVVIGGSNIYHGAPTLAGLAALRCGTDLVTIHAPDKVISRIGAQSPDLIIHPYKGTHLTVKSIPLIVKQLEKADSIILGP